MRIAGVNVGKVKTKSLDEGGDRTIVEIELDEALRADPAGHARDPAPEDAARRDLRGALDRRQVVAACSRTAQRLPDAQVEPTVELDEIFGAFDEPTRRAFQAVDGRARRRRARARRPQDLNDAFGNLAPFATDGAELLSVLDEQETAVQQLIRNTGAVFGAINEREGALRELIVNSNNTFEATASRDDALAETFEIFPIFLDESKATLARLEDFSRDTRPLVNDLKAPADDLGPTVRDLGDLAPDLENLFRDLPPLIAASRRSVPEMERVLEEAEPLFEQLHPFFQELNPILSYFNFHQATLAGFISNAAPDLSGDFGGDRYQVNVGIIESTGFQRHMKRPDSERGNAYLRRTRSSAPSRSARFESFDCAPSGGEKRNAEDAEGANPAAEGGPEAPALPGGAAVDVRRQAVRRSSRAARRPTGARRASARATAPRSIRTRPIRTTEQRRRSGATIRRGLHLRQGLPAGWARGTSASTWSSRSSRRSWSASATVGIFALYTETSPAEFWRVVAVAEAAVAVAVACRMAKAWRLARPVVDWVRAGRQRGGRARGVALRGRRCRASSCSRNGWQAFVIVGLPVAVYATIEFELPAYSALIVFAGSLVAVAYAAILHFFGVGAVHAAGARGHRAAAAARLQRRPHRRAAALEAARRPAADQRHHRRGGERALHRRQRLARGPGARRGRGRARRVHGLARADAAAHQVDPAPGRRPARGHRGGQARRPRRARAGGLGRRAGRSWRARSTR